jgi:hypothetical protein
MMRADSSRWYMVKAKFPFSLFDLGHLLLRENELSDFTLKQVTGGRIMLTITG